jgi:hypothetical protein
MKTEKERNEEWVVLGRGCERVLIVPRFSFFILPPSSFILHLPPSSFILT